MSENLLELQPHGLSVALFQPQIAPNTGNIARLCVATGCDLHLVRPLGFVLDDRQLKRSAMDYWPRLKYTVHDDIAQFFSSLGNRRFWLLDSSGTQSHFTADFVSGDVLIFGSETKGIDPRLLHAHSAKTLRIPQVNGERCLNLSTSVGIVVYEAIRKIMQ